ncbi:putative F-box protein At2g02030 [Apium graveolens]|uniref:putative F-box protein At2g02030 n=1 Tax=Apium graveolens TaxID=4045 RepID=UPI003D7BE346
MAKLAKTSIPDDIMYYEILSRLPVESLIRLKSVSKTWLSVISSSVFVKSFIDRAYTNAKDDKTLVVQLCGEKEVDRHSYALFHLGSGQLVTNLGSPYSSDGEEYLVDFERDEAVLIGSDCGIVCLLVSVEVKDYDDYCDGFDIHLSSMYRTYIYLWNPATKRVNLISADNDHNETCREVIGFGFDCMNLDFKVIRAVCDQYGDVDYFGVYSANRNSWKQIEVDPIDDFYYNTDVYSNGCLFDVCLHGFLLCTGYRGMIAFDLHKELLYCRLELPDIDCETVEATITDFNDSIAVFTSNDEKFKLWTLDDEECLRGGEVKTSWTMMLRIDLGQPIQFVVGYFNHGDLLLVSKDGSLLSYNFDKKEARELEARFDYRQVFKYTESLISVQGSEPVYSWSDSEDDYSDSEDNDSDQEDDD